MIHYRFASIEQDGGTTVSGTAIKYGDVATFLTRKGSKVHEVVEPGAMRIPDNGVRLTVQHDAVRSIGHTRSNLELDVGDDAISFRADLGGTSLGREALEQVKAGFLNGASVEMAIHDQHLVGKTIHITKATLGGIGLVDSPAYPDSEIEARMAELLRHMPKKRFWL